MSKRNGHNGTRTPRKVLPVEAQEGEDRDVALARTALRPSVRGGITICQLTEKLLPANLDKLIAELSTQAKLAIDGNLGRAEATLAVQAHTLDAIFNELARRAALNMGEYLNACELYMRLALKAQSQCRATLETLAAIKNPAPVAFVRQANIAHGPQQVNNATPAQPSRARESQNQPSKLLEQQSEERLDNPTSATTSRADSQLESVEALNRTEDTGRKDSR